VCFSKYGIKTLCVSKREFVRSCNPWPKETENPEETQQAARWGFILSNRECTLGFPKTVGV
jgi:hypothetical protein